MNLSRKARREILLILFFVCLFSYAYLLTFGLGGFIQLNRVRGELRQLELENRQLHELNTRKLWEVEQIKNNPDNLEKILREKLGYARPGDVIITLPNNEP